MRKCCSNDGELQWAAMAQWSGAAAGQRVGYDWGKAIAMIGLVAVGAAALVRPDLLVQLGSCIQNTRFLAHAVGTISQFGLCNRERLSTEALDGASRRGIGADGIVQGLPPASAARAYLDHYVA